MKHLRLPYGAGALDGLFPDDASVITSRISELTAEADGSTLVRRAMAAPIGSPRLAELAGGKKDAVIIISDHTRPVPSRDILPHMLAELRQGNPDIDITLLVATGCHRGTTAAELEAKLGSEIFRSEKIVVHDCDNPDNVLLGTLPSGAPLVIDRIAAQTELLTAEGFIEPHFFAGFSGGRKSVLPGICGRETVLGNHCSAFVHSTSARTGILEGNPIHTDMLAAARMANLQYIVNVVVDDAHRTAAAFAGDMQKAHAAGCAFLKSWCLAAPAYGDIVVTTNGGAPLDQNIYQCVKSMTAAEACANPGAVIIACAQCADGVGGAGFFRDLSECESAQALYSRIMATPQDKTLPDQWQSQVLARVLIKHPVIFVTGQENRAAIEAMKMTWAGSLDDAMAQARAIKGPDAAVTVIPNGVSVIIG